MARRKRVNILLSSFQWRIHHPEDAGIDAVLVQLGLIRLRRLRDLGRDGGLKGLGVVEDGGVFHAVVLSLSRETALPYFFLSLRYPRLFAVFVDRRRVTWLLWSSPRGPKTAPCAERRSVLGG
jgi:hypothetical protein